MQKELRLLNQLIDRILGLDPQKEFLLQQLNNEILAIIIQDLNLHFFLIPDDHTLNVTQEAPDKPINYLSANANDFISMLINKHPESFIQQQRVTFEGNLQTLQAYQRFFKAIRPDLLFYLSNKTHRSVTYILKRPIQTIKQWLLASRSSFHSELIEYLHEEKRLFPCKEEVDDFFDDIQTLKQDCDRLTEKMKHLLPKGLSNAPD
ncbi:ubiquinone biosynthesis accessory factor UbiJ [Facilibium subflavum]|uniref:ubiquinone biosynthesis accessory factor UbiJ n=1 Tax=Facilibium subflavum TaxID=2219058 RepID=UPI000E64A249|nr:SCP2 sterol-binding domain-containing protein [Facilibium subflavum]